MNAPLRYWLVVPAAGEGRRFGSDLPKQFAPLRDSTVLELALAPFLADERCAGIVLVLSGARLAGRPPLRAMPNHLARVAGGAERADSVLAGLEALAAGALGQSVAGEEWVLVHDAARPCLSARDLERLLAEGGSSAEGALLAMPIADTIKQEGAGQRSAMTVPRAPLWRALTPQMFRLGPLTSALRAARAAGRLPTDEAEALEWLGMRPLLVEAQDSNIKVTTAEDLKIAQAVLDGRVS
ncbi:MAG: 2-C-methyl-D-erythritol 4-phosphate cytidylyltransferase [Steroidobacteraceae bacterium]